MGFGARPVIHREHRRAPVRSKFRDRRKFSRSAANTSSANLRHTPMRGGYRI